MSCSNFDFVVVGGGTAGCIVAARLAEAGSYEVALIEAGSDDNNFWIRTPLGFGKLYTDPRFTWLYESEPESELEGARCPLPRGKVLGGSGSINGMVYLRGQREDFDQWRRLGNVGWSYEDVLPYFKKCERNEHGGVSSPPQHELADAFINASEEAGFVRNDNLNGSF